MAATQRRFDAAVRDVRGGISAADAARALVAELHPDEKLSLLDGDQGFWRGFGTFFTRGYNLTPIVAGAIPRLGIPGIRFTDGPRGVVMNHSTCFPVAIARGAAWDVALEEEIGRAIGEEARAEGANLFAGVCINLLRHPAWGRAQETFGEDPILLGEMGAALTRGVREHVMACVKHYALNSMENARFIVDVEVPEDVLHEVYLAHFRRVVNAGADSVMSAYNSVNGEWAGQNAVLLTEILRDEWGFEGFVISDFMWGLRDAVKSVKAGLDVEMPFRQQRARRLRSALDEGALSIEDVDAAAVRILAGELKHYARLGEPGASPAPSVAAVVSPEHRALARRAASRGMVLLKNEVVGGRPLLPLARTASLAVVGPLADAPNTGDTGSSMVRPPSAVSPLAGLRAAFLGPVADDDGSDVSRAAAVAASADVAIVVAGYTAHDEGEAIIAVDPAALALMGPPLDTERGGRLVSGLIRRQADRGKIAGGDRSSLTLKPADERLIRAVSAANPRTVVVVVAGSTVIVEAWRHTVPAILLAWYPGMEGGHALADVLTGTVEPGGRLPAAMVADADDLPFFEPFARHIVYDRWFGQRKLDRDGRPAAYPFGFGLGYTTFAFGELSATVGEGDGRADDVGQVTATVAVANTGDRDGGAVVQLYAAAPDLAADRPVRQLLGFARADVPAGASVTVEVAGSLKPLARRDPATKTWSIVPASYRLEAARFSGDHEAATIPLRLPE